MTTVTKQNPVRTDLATTPAEVAATSASRSLAWALAGVGAAVMGAATLVTSGTVDVVYREEFRGTSQGVAQALAEKTGVLFVFHSVTALGAVLMIVFGAGLFRRLRAVAPDSIAPTLALVGLAGTAVVSVLGSGLDTEFMFPAPGDQVPFDDASGAFFNHWIGTIPWLWTLTGLAGLAIYAVSRSQGAPRWLGRVGLVLGGLTLLLGISPMEYMAGMTGVVWLLVTAIGFTAGDRAFRSAP